MTLTFIFWLMMFLWLVFGIWSAYPFGTGNGKLVAGNLFLFIILFVVGWKLFGFPIQG